MRACYAFEEQRPFDPFLIFRRSTGEIFLRIHTFFVKLWAFLTRVVQKGIQYISLIFVGSRVNRIMPFQYSELIYLKLHQK